MGNCEISVDGVVLAWVSGAVGTQLPSTSPASEHVAALATIRFPNIDEVRSDYKGLDQFETPPPHQVLSRKGLYSGVKRLLRGIAPERRITHVRGHASPNAAANSEELYKALGNNAVDVQACLAADRLSRPSAREE